MLEDNGFLPQPFVSKQMSATFQMMHNGASEIKKMGDDWLIMWSTKQIKLVDYTGLKRFQKVNQFPKSNELTRKDLLIERIQRMQEIHNTRQFDFIPLTLTIPKEVNSLVIHM